MNSRISIALTSRQEKYLDLVSRQTGNSKASIVRLTLNNEIEKQLSANNVSSTEKYLKTLADGHPLKSK